MALDATVGGSSANSYNTVAEGDAYFATRPFATAWTGLSGGTATATKESALIMASRTIDARLCFRGVSVSATQSMRFPITGIVGRNGHVLADTVIPPEIKQAVFELALLLLTSDVTLQSDVAAQGITGIKAGPVELKFSEGVEVQPVPENIRQMIPAAWYCAIPATGGRMVFRALR